jgi:ATP/maltotriose-dependent transcriptional regulator MalT
MNRKSGEVAGLLQESAALLTSGTDKWGRAHVLNLQGYEAFRALDLDLARDLHRASHELAVELGDHAGQAENLLALGHIHLLRGEDEAAARALEESRSLVEQLRDPHQLAHADQALALLAVSRGSVAEGEALLADTARRFVELGRAPIGSAYAIGLADIYRRGGRPALATVLLRHALSLLNESESPADYARARRELTALEGATADAGGGAR